MAKTLKVASWNVNSIRVRTERLAEWLSRRAPDVLCLQETKSLDAQFPAEVFAALGYQAAIFGQKAYNGVAILSRRPMCEVQVGFAGEPREPQAFEGPLAPEARLIAATIEGLRIHSVYVPNGQSIQSDRYPHKLRWLGRLGAHLDRLGTARPVLLCGDFNVAPDTRDLYAPGAFEQDVIFHQDIRNAYARLVGPRGLVDTFRLHHPETGHYSWWDYRMLSFPKNRGLRIDLILADPRLAAACVSSEIDRDARGGPLPSDHAPILADFNLEALPESAAAAPAA